MGEVFDKKEVFETEIMPILEALLDKCKDHGIPLFVNCLPFDDENSTNSRTMCYLGCDLMRDRDSTNMYCVMREIVAGIPQEMLAAFMMIIDRYRKCASTENNEEERRQQEPAKPGSTEDMKESMLAQVLGRLGMKLDDD